MLLDLPHPAYIHQALPTFPVEQERRIDSTHSWVPSFTKPSNLAALASSERQIEELCRMPRGWDGYGALPISSITKYNSLQALRGILGSAPAPDITPNPNGTLSFEWETERGVAHLEIGQTRISFYIEPVSGEPVFLDALCDDILVVAIKIGILISSNLFPLRYATTSVTDVHLAIYVSTAY